MVRSVHNESPLPGPETTNRALGLPDDAFEQRTPLRGQITKREVRAVAIYSMGLRPDSLIWDIGAGTGSVSVEAGLIATRGKVFAIERDLVSVPLLEKNPARWGTSNVHMVVGEAPEVLAELPDPDAVFIGGSGGNLDLIIDYVSARLKPGGHIVINLSLIHI